MAQTFPWSTRIVGASGLYSFSRGLRASYENGKEKQPVLYSDRLLFSLGNGIIALCPPFAIMNAWQLLLRLEVKCRKIEINKDMEYRIYTEWNNGVCKDTI